MLQSTVQSRKVVLTEDEKDYFANQTDEDLMKLDEELAKEREILKTNTNNGFSGIDYYNDLQEEQHTYNVSLKHTLKDLRGVTCFAYDIRVWPGIF